MDRAALATAIADAIIEGRRHERGMLGIMEDGEIAQGRQVIPLGATEPFAFSSADFSGGLLSRDGDEIRIVVVQARHEGVGAFRRLVNAIQRAGLRPVVVEPVGQAMPAIMKRWRWQPRTIGQGWESVTEWRPSPTPTHEVRHG